MKIWGEIPKILGVYDKQKSIGKAEKTTGVASRKDVVSISSQAKDYQAVMRALKDVPDVRQDRVDELLKRFESGSYNVSGRDIADRIIRSVFDRKA